MWKILVLCTIAGVATAEVATFNNYKVFRIIPNSVAQIETLRQLDTFSDGVSRSTEM